MSDPRNVAHAKKVKQEKEHDPAGAGSSRKPGRQKKRAAEVPAEAAASANEVKESQIPGDLEKAVAVLSKLKDLEFHSRANIETLAQLTLTIEDELKQKEFSEPIGALYSAQDVFQTKITALIGSYTMKCETMKQPG